MMKKTSTFALICFCLLSVKVQVIGSINGNNQKQRPLKFEMILCAVGFLHSHQSYKASDGSFLTVDNTTYDTTKLAQAVMNEQIESPIRMIEDKDRFNRKGKKIGTRVIAVIRDEDAEERTIMIQLEERKLYTIEAASLRHIKDFQKSGLGCKDV